MFENKSENVSTNQHYRDRERTVTKLRRGGRGIVDNIQSHFAFLASSISSIVKGFPGRAVSCGSFSNSSSAIAAGK